MLLGGELMEIDNKTIEDYELWNDFISELSYKNRYFCNHEILSRVKKIITSSVITLSENDSIYRARIFNEDVSIFEKHKADSNKNLINENDANNPESLYLKIEEMKEKSLIERKILTSFWGYDEEKSYIPLENEFVKSGRANPSKIIYLYAADEPITAATEIRGIIGDYVSIAEIKIIEELRIIDLSYNLLENVGEEDQFLAYLIIKAFNAPNQGDEFKYIPTQYICEFIKSLDFDGIKYCSSLYPRGRNYAIFKVNKCNPINSSLYRVEDVCYNLKRIGPSDSLFNNHGLFHWKLESFIEESRKTVKSIFDFNGKL